MHIRVWYRQALAHTVDLPLKDFRVHF